MKSDRRKGQALVEYVVATGMLLGVLLMLTLFLYTFKEYGKRILDLIAFDYP